MYKVYLLCEPIFYAWIAPTLGLNQGERVLYKAYLLGAHLVAHFLRRERAYIGLSSGRAGFLQS